LTDQQENLDIFERLKNKQKTLVAQFSILKNQEGKNQEASGLDQIHAEVQRFARETSLTIAVLLSRSAKNASELTQLLTQLGFPDVYPRNRSDHFVYNFLVNIFIFFGVVLTCLLFGGSGGDSYALQICQLDQSRFGPRLRDRDNQLPDLCVMSEYWTIRGQTAGDAGLAGKSGKYARTVLSQAC